VLDTPSSVLDTPARVLDRNTRVVDQEAHGHAQRGDLEPQGGSGEVDAPTFAFRAILTDGRRIFDTR